MQVNGEVLPLRKRRRGEKIDKHQSKPNSSENEQCSQVEGEENPNPMALRLCRDSADGQRESPTRRSPSAAVNFSDILPDPVCHIIFSKLPPRYLAGRCSLVCKTWSRIVANEGAWKDLCTRWNLQESDTKKVLGGWRGLYAIALGTNLVQSSHFERLYTNESCASGSEDDFWPFEARAKIMVERLCTAGGADFEYRSRSHWTDDLEFTAGNIVPPTNGVYRITLAPGECCSREEDRSMNSRRDRDADDPHCKLLTSTSSPFDGSNPAAPCTGFEVLRTEHSLWGRLKQQISLASFPERFLDSCPPMHVSALCRPVPTDGNSHPRGEIRLQLDVCHQDGSPLHNWDSGELEQEGTGWRTVAAVVHNYPPGMREVTVRIAGKGTDFTSIKVTFDTPQSCA